MSEVVEEEASARQQRQGEEEEEERKHQQRRWRQPPEPEVDEVQEEEQEAEAEDGEEDYDEDGDIFEEDDDMDSPQQISPIPKLTELKLTGLPSNRTHNREAARRIQRENVMLLTKLDEIHRKGGDLKPKPRAQQARKHIASSSVNRRRHQRETASQNKAFLKRLVNVKSTVPKATTKTKAKPGPPRSRKQQPPSRSGAPRHKLVQPEWVD